MQGEASLCECRSAHLYCLDTFTPNWRRRCSCASRESGPAGKKSLSELRFFFLRRLAPRPTRRRRLSGRGCDAMAIHSQGPYALWVALSFLMQGSGCQVPLGGAASRQQGGKSLLLSVQRRPGWSFSEAPFPCKPSASRVNYRNRRRILHMTQWLSALMLAGPALPSSHPFSF